VPQEWSKKSDPEGDMLRRKLRFWGPTVGVGCRLYTFKLEVEFLGRI
jgi:hypothetical protein